jgi:hypothetical protein
MFWTRWLGYFLSFLSHGPNQLQHGWGWNLDHARYHDVVQSLIDKKRVNKYFFVQILFFLFKKIIDTWLNKDVK